VLINPAIEFLAGTIVVCLLVIWVFTGFGIFIIFCPSLFPTPEWIRLSVLVFDIYGTFYKTIPLKKLLEFNVVNGDLFYYENKTLKQYQTKTFNTIEKQFNDTLLKTVYWQNNHFYKVYQDSLVVQ
jgi:hypothetical protein